MGDLYHLCFQGVWFMSRSANGPWETAATVPASIYQIPPSSPVYNVTYVKTDLIGEGKDVNGHGTGIAGIIHALAPEAEIGSFRVLRMGLFDLTSKRDIIQRAAFDAIDRGYQILNCSFGCRGEKEFIMEFKDWVDEAYVKGIHVTSACSNRDYTEREWPAYFPTVVTVDRASIDQVDQIFYRPGNLVEFVAKGQYADLLFLDGKKRNGFGTSFPPLSRLRCSPG